MVLNRISYHVTEMVSSTAGYNAMYINCT